MSDEIKKLLKELLNYKKKLIVVAIAGICMALADTINVNLIKKVFDGLQNQNTLVIKETFAWIILFAFIKAVSRYLHLFNMNYVSELVTQGLRQKLQQKFMRLNLSFHNNYASGSGGLISRILNDLVIIKDGFRMFADFFREPVLFVGLIGTLFYLNYKLTLMILIVFPLILFFMSQISKSIKKYSLRGQEDLEKITSTIKESLDGVRIIQSYNLEKEMAERFERESQNFIYSRKRIHSLIECSGPITEFIVTVMIFSIILYMTLSISKGKATYGDFMGYISALLMLSSPVKKLQESYVRVQETSVAAKRAMTLLDQNNEVPQSDSLQPFPQNWKVIEYKNVSFKYGDIFVLKNINLKIFRGEMLAFVGASGSGKSTLVNLLERFFDPTEGDIFIDQTPIHKINLKELRKNIALVTQDVFLFSDSIENNIWSGDFSRKKEGVINAAQSANAHDFIMKSSEQYQSRVGDRGNLLSGGEKQRISIARAIFKDAPLLILDEATSALDSNSEVEVQKGLDSLVSGRTSLVIAHRLSTVSKADRIVVLKDGQIVELGQHEDLLMTKGEYAHIYNLQYNNK